MYGPEILLTPREAATPEGSLCPFPDRHHAVAFALHAIDCRYFDSGLCLKQVAGDLRCSLWHLGRLLRRDTGLGFTAHLRQRRVLAAQALLRESALPLKAIAAQAGFATASQFSRQFVLAVGLTPSVFRRRAHVHRDAPQMTSEHACWSRASNDNR